jgi:hypothetical protein
MLTFWIIAALLILLALWFGASALLQKPNQAEEGNASKPTFWSTKINIASWKPI